MRLVKDGIEIETMRKAASLTALGHKRAMEAVRPDVCEYQLQHAMEYEWLSRGVNEYLSEHRRQWTQCVYLALPPRRQEHVKRVSSSSSMLDARWMAV